MEKEVKKLLTLLCVVTFFVVFVVFYQEDTKDLETVLSHISGDTIRFSAQTGYYTDTLTVTLTPDFEIPASAKIYYTLNGDDPVAAGEEYHQSIILEAEDGQTRFYPLKAAICYAGQFGEVVQRTYVIGSGDAKFSMPVVSITCANADLYDPETGIFSHPRSRGDEWVRDAYITMLDSTGDVLLDQAVGLAVSGGTSANLPVKALKVLSVSGGVNFDAEQDRLELNLLCGNRTASSYAFVTRYNSIRFRAGSQDMPRGNIRSSVISRLAEESNFDGCTMTHRCAVYLNGAFYGVFDMQQNYSSSFLARRFGLPGADSVAKWKGSEGSTFAAAGVADYFDLDLDDPENRVILEQAVDMDNYLLYYAINILANNTDWPDNNFEIWKYVGEYDPDNPYSDGRIRFLIYDTDLVYYSEESADFFDGSLADTLVSIMNGSGRGTSSNFPKVMQCAYYRNKFLTIVSDLRNTAFAQEHIQEIVDEEWEKIRGEYLEQLGQEQVDSLLAHISLMKKGISQRPGEIGADFAEYFHAQDTYSVSICNEGAVSISWNQMELYQGETYENAYYCGTDFTMDAAAYPGWEFCYWLVNGEPVYGSTLTLSDDLAKDGAVAVETVARRLEGPQIIISEISANQSDDWIRITNVGQDSVMLSDYYLSDDAANYRKYQLPEILLNPEQSIVIDGKSNYYALGDYICNFNLNNDEILYFSDGTTVVDCMAVPRMGALETYGRYDDSAVLKYYYNPNGERRTA